jgi:hypothetical protein
MSNYTVEVGAKPLLIGQYAVNIDTAISLTLPTTGQLTTHAGVMELFLSVETQNARFTLDGTSPTTTNGVLLTAPGFLTLRGQAIIAALKIIGVAAGGTINYGFTVDALI